jgi:molybdopterin-guanine dinucleotide biosynthesis protein A
MLMDAVVLAGGRSSRMGSAHKAALVFGGRSLLQCAVDAAGDSRSIVVVAPDGLLRGISRVIAAREFPAWGGPAAALVAGVEALPEPRAEWLLVLACDLPLAGDAVAALLAGARLDAAPADLDGVVAVDSAGRRQPLLAVYRTAALELAAARRDGPLTGLPLRSLLAGLTLVEVSIDDDLLADVDTPDQARSFGIEVPGQGGALVI